MPPSLMVSGLTVESFPDNSHKIPQKSGVIPDITGDIDTFNDIYNML